MLLFESIKQFLFPHIDLWESHTLTILFTSTITTIAAYFVGKTLATTNAKLEARTAEILEAHRRLAAESYQVTTLSQMGELLQSCRDSEELNSVFQQFAQRLFPENSVTLWAISESRNVVEVVAYWGTLSPAESVFAPDDCWALRRGQVHLTEEASGRLCKHLAENASFPTLCVPLMAHSETLGLLHVQNGSGGISSTSVDSGGFTGSRRQAAVAMAGHIALALANLKLSEKLRNQSIRDALTGLFNRRYMEETLEREVQRAARNKQRVALLMLDIDRFKQFNDTFGHQAGDSLLRAFGNFLKQRTRGQDVACRFGGEEFVVILAGATIEDAARRAEVLRDELKQLTVQHVGQVLGAVTISAGVAAYPESGTTAEDLLQATDQALYRAKAGGRDRVVLA